MKCPECGGEMHDVRNFVKLAGKNHPDFICKCGHEEKVNGDDA